MSPDPRFDSLAGAGVAEPVVAALRDLVERGDARELAHINAIWLAHRRGLDEQQLIDGLLRASRVGLFDMTWTVHCTQCSSAIDRVGSCQAIRSSGYYCTACDLSHEVTLDSVVEATFTVAPRVRQIPTHVPEALPLEDYVELLSFSSRIPRERTHAFVQSQCLALQELPAAGKVTLSLNLEPGLTVIREPIARSTAVLHAEGARRMEPVSLGLAFGEQGVRLPTQTLRPGPVTLTVQNESNQRLSLVVHGVDDGLRDLFQARQPYLSAKRLFTHPTFRELFRTDALDIDQQLKVESLTLLFTDLKGSTELYERVGDLAAFDLVRKHFAVLEGAVKSHQGSVVKTIGDAVMAVFSTPELGVRAAIQMQEQLARFNQQRGHDDLLIKVGLHDGPCLAVMLNGQLDYFGQTVNIAARVQGLADAQSILTTRTVLDAPGVARVVEEQRLKPGSRRASLKGIKEEMTLYELGRAA